MKKRIIWAIPARLRCCVRVRARARGLEGVLMEIAPELPLPSSPGSPDRGELD